MYGIFKVFVFVGELMSEMIELKKIERQVLLYEVLSRSEIPDKKYIFSYLPIGNRMLERDMKDLSDAGLINLRFDRKKKCYVKNEKEYIIDDSEWTEAKRRHLKRLYRICHLIDNLQNDEVTWNEEFIREEKMTAAKSYREMFPECSPRTMQKDFATLNRIGYPIEYDRKLRYYKFFDNANHRESFGVYRNDAGKLARKIGVGDYERQELDEDAINPQKCD